jgi:hypothetical protein
VGQRKRVARNAVRDIVKKRVKSEDIEPKNID